MPRILAGLTFVFALLAAGPAVGAEPYFTDDGAAIRGYDPVAYFEAGEPVEGSPEHSLQWGGVTWHFASAANREAFAADPQRYAPQYGGYCAYAVANGDLVSIDPDAWSIVDGKLYLNYSTGVRRRWEQDIPGYIAQADAEWPELDPAK